MFFLLIHDSQLNHDRVAFVRVVCPSVNFLNEAFFNRSDFELV